MSVRNHSPNPANRQATSKTMRTSNIGMDGYLTRITGSLMLGLVLYVLTAPPLMMMMTRQNPREWPCIYNPLVVGFQCDWTRPLFSWYFDTVWGADTEIRGE